MFRGRFRVYQIVSFLWSVTPKFLKFTQNNGMAIWNINCRVESVNGTFEQIIRNSVRNSMFSKLCPISLNTFPKILQLMGGYIVTVLNSLESVLGFFYRIPRNVSRKITCFPYCVILCEALLRWSSNLTRITLRLFGVVSKNLELVVNILSKFQDIPSKIPCFPDCVISA